MKVKNDYISISVGNKNIKIQNTIMDIYLKELLKIQFQKSKSPTDISLRKIYFKFDDTIDIMPDMEIDDSDFDCSFTDSYVESNHMNESVVVDYTYKIDQSVLMNFEGRKITAIGFGWFNGINYTIGAIVDTNNYGIYIESQKEFLVARRDLFSSDGIFYSSRIKGMLHMYPLIEEGWRGNNDIRWGVLKSVGLGVVINDIMEEYEFEDYGSELTMQEFGFDINKGFIIEHLHEGLFPDLDLYPEANLYPARVINQPIYPSYDIFPGIDIYPMEVPYQYIQLKYQVYEIIGGESETPTETQDYYIINSLINQDYNKIKEKVRYERA